MKERNSVMGTVTTLCMGYRDGKEVRECGKLLGTVEHNGPDMTSHGVCAECFVITTGVPDHWKGKEGEYAEVCRAIYRDRDTVRG